MHVLIVLDHPDPASFSGAAAQHFQVGCKEAGHTVEVADLHAEGFDPRWTMADIEREACASPPYDVVKEQERIACADAICLVFPLFWWGMPSMTKGWVDRVWAWGWAYDQLNDREQSLQRPRSGVLLIPAGARSDDMEESGYLSALETAWIQGTFGYFGFSPRKLELLWGSTGSIDRRKALLEHCCQVGLNLASPESI